MSLIDSKYIPAEGDPNAKIWVIGEAPGDKERDAGKPFVGPAGQLLTETFLREGISREQLYLTNLCHYKPAWNKFESLIGSDQLQEGLDEIRNTLATKSPNVVVLCGAQPFRYLTNKKGGIKVWRGSIIRVEDGPKAVPVLHPAYVLRDPLYHSVFNLDIQRVVEESETPNLNLPEYDIKIDPIDIDWQDKILMADIESVKGTSEIICVGFSPNWTSAIVYTDHRRDIVAHLLRENKIVFQNGYFDVALLMDNGINEINWYGDTFLQAKNLDPEFPRGQDFLASIFTRQPHYKGSGRASLPGDTKSWAKTTERGDVYVYNAKDTATGKQIYDKQEANLNSDSEAKRTYDFDMELAPALVWMSRNGCLIDEERREELRKEVDKERVQNYLWLWALVKEAIGEEKKFTVGQNKVIGNIFYDEIGLPEKKKRNTKRQSVRTTDDNALVALIANCKAKIEDLKTEKGKAKWELALGIVKLIKKLRGLEKLKSSYIDYRVSDDGRVRGSYRSATETGRLSCNLYPDGTGLNQQTWPRAGRTRTQIVAPKGYEFLYMDYSQIESWFTAHYANELNMIDALTNGDIHAQTAAFLFDSTEEEMKKDKPKRYIGKQSNHALGYRMGWKELVRNINNKGVVTISNREGKGYYDGWHMLYNVKAWWRELEDDLGRDRTLITCYGRKRTFFQFWGDELFKSATAHIPQSSAADHCMGLQHPELGIQGGILGIYHRYKNVSEVRLVASAHDSILMEVPKGVFQEVAEEVYELMHRPCVVNGVEFTVPLDIERGDRWGELEEFKMAA